MCCFSEQIEMMDRTDRPIYRMFDWSISRISSVSSRNVNDTSSPVCARTNSLASRSLATLIIHEARRRPCLANVLENDTTCRRQYGQLFDVVVVVVVWGVADNVRRVGNLRRRIFSRVDRRAEVDVERFIRGRYWREVATAATDAGRSARGDVCPVSDVDVHYCPLRSAEWPTFEVKHPAFDLCRRLRPTALTTRQSAVRRISFPLTRWPDLLWLAMISSRTVNIMTASVKTDNRSDVKGCNSILPLPLLRITVKCYTGEQLNCFDVDTLAVQVFIFQH